MSKNNTISFTGKLMSIGEKVNVSSKGKNFKVVTLKFKTLKGDKKKCQALCFEGNYKHGISIGQKYLCEAILNTDGVLVVMSHLKPFDKITKEDFK